jgi:uncharacterized protein YndB with AHSA1/START domain
MSVVHSFDVARPPDEVFAFMTDPTRFPVWQRDVVRVEGDGATGVGSRFTTIRRIAGVERSMTQEVTHVEAPRRWAARGVDGVIRTSAEVSVEPVEDGAGARVTVTLTFTGHGVGEMLVPVVERLSRKGAPASYRRLAALLGDSGAPRPA